MSDLEDILKAWKKGHKNALPEPTDLCETLGIKAEAVADGTQDLVYEIILGKRSLGPGVNAQARQKSVPRSGAR